MRQLWDAPHNVPGNVILVLLLCLVHRDSIFSCYNDCYSSFFDSLSSLTFIQHSVTMLFLPVECIALRCVSAVLSFVCISFLLSSEVFMVTVSSVSLFYWRICQCVYMLITDWAVIIERRKGGREKGEQDSDWAEKENELGQRGRQDKERERIEQDKGNHLYSARRCQMQLVLESSYNFQRTPSISSSFSPFLHSPICKSHLQNPVKCHSVQGSIHFLNSVWYRQCDTGILTDVVYQRCIPIHKRYTVYNLFPYSSVSFQNPFTWLY